MRALERYLNKLIRNPFIKKDNLMKDFLTLNQKKFKTLREKNSKQNNFNLKSLTETLIIDPFAIPILFKVKRRIYCSQAL